MNRKDSEDLVRVGPGTTMGELMRQYCDSGGDVVGG